MYRTITLHPQTAAERQLTKFERALGEAVLSEEDPRLQPAREQLKLATVKQRELTPWGFYVDLVLPGDAPTGDADVLTTPLGGASVTGDSTTMAVTAHINCKGGRLSSIEGAFVGDVEPTFEEIERLLLDRRPAVEITRCAPAETHRTPRLM